MAYHVYCYDDGHTDHLDSFETRAEAIACIERVRAELSALGLEPMRQVDISTIPPRRPYEVPDLTSSLPYC
jgi:hypothetical protein